MVGTVVITAFLYYQFWATPVLSFWSLRGWEVMAATVALLMGALSRLWHRRFTPFILSAASGLMACAIFLEVQFGQHDTTANSTWLFMVQNALSNLRLYDMSALLPMVVGWYVANRVAISLTSHRETGTSR